MYDRSILRAVAREKGDRNSADMARRLNIAFPTAWRLWNGKAGTSADIADRVREVYGLTYADLTRKQTA